MPRGIMREFKINEISGVDRPAQKGARVAIIKRDTDMTTHTVVQACLANHERASGAFSKAELYRAVCDLAEEDRKPGESVYKARARIQTSHAGAAAVMQAYALAKNEPPSPKAEKRMAPEQFRKQIPGGSVVAQIDSIAEQIAREEKVPLTKARMIAWGRNPDLREAYGRKRSVLPVHAA